ncbi:MAG: GNAT family N-acetyltransferase [Planctomycetaceae bacterium]|nr:GNAT family N-acetyltransferase [Planctomycetaceae bacterium]
MNDTELLAAFEDWSLPHEQWTHHAHVRVAYLYASQSDLRSATDRIRNAIKAYNTATKTPDSLDRGYHETITRAFMTLVFAAIDEASPCRSSDEFCHTHPELLSKQTLLTYYSRDFLLSWDAKAHFVLPDLQTLPVVSPDSSEPASDPCDYHIAEKLTDKHVVELYDLIRSQWWGGQRSLDDVRQMVQNTSLMLGLIEHSSNRLVGYCRTLTDFTFRATIYDVMVEESLQGRGLGKRLMDAMHFHPRLQNVSFIYLACEPDLYSFYAQWGFKTYEGRAQWMIKVQREESASNGASHD